MNKSTTFRGEPDPYRPQPKKQPHHAPASASETKPAPAPETRPAAVVHEPGKLYEGDVPVHTEPPAHH